MNGVVSRTLCTLALAGLLVTCTGAVGEPVESATLGATPLPTVTPPATTPATPRATVEPTATPEPLPARCRDGGSALAIRLERLEADIAAAMEGYPGQWSVGLVDLDCDVELAVRAEHFQYAASAGKIVPVIAALRAVDESTVELPRPWEPVPQTCGSTRRAAVEPGSAIEFATLEPPLLLVMRHSCDHEADLINGMVSAEQIREVLELAGVSERTQFAHSWHFAGMPALDLARVWAALLDGRLLGPGLSTYLLDLASRPEIPEGLETFPAEAQIPGHQFGQKAGFCIVCPPYSLIGLGAGYVRPVEEPPDPISAGATRAELGHGVGMVLMLQTTDPLRGPQRRDVFPLLVEYVVQVE